MEVGSIKSWHCLFIAIVLGLSVGAARQWAGDPSNPANIPAELTGQQLRFEDAVLGQLEGNPLATNITVTPRQMRGRDGKSHLFHVVSADVSSGLAEKTSAGRRLNRRPTLFLMPVPYQPRVPLENLRGPALPDPAAEFARASTPTVLDFLRLAQISRGTEYSYAWWEVHPMLVWTAGSVLVIGILLPAGVNLLAFGSLRRPREEKADSLSDVVSATAPGATTRADDDAALDQMVETMEAAVEPAAPIPIPAEQKPVAPKPKPLSEAPVAPAPAPAKSDDQAFALKAEDFYPTELKGRPRHES
jgi:hypothetical protein